jgi:DNA-binding transcriptional LysR family regulator
MDRIDAMRLFVRLAERGSFSAAAKDLRIKQSTASKWIAELEAQLGVSLIERTTRRLHVTEAGRRFQARAAEVLASFDGITGELREASPEPSGLIRLSLPVVFGRRFVVPIVVEFLTKFPKVEAELSLNDRYVNLVEEGFDVAVRIGTPVDTSARARKLADTRRRLVASPAYIAAHGQPVTPADLVSHQCILFRNATAGATWSFRHRRHAEATVRVHGRTAADNSDAILQLSRSGLGIALLADWLVEEDLRAESLVSLLDDYDPSPAPIFALTPPGRYTTALVRMLIEHLVSSLAARRSCLLD